VNEMDKAIRCEKDRKFEQELEPLRGYVTAVASKYLGGYSCAEDLAQEILVKAWKHFDRLPQAEADLKQWLCVTARRAAVDYWRLQGRQVEYGASIDITGSYANAADDRILPPAVCEPAYLPDPFVLSAVKAFLDGLPANQRQVLLLSVLEMPYELMATETGTSIGTVRSRLHYTRKKAKRALASYL
jgi:RNA polymerase sigma-70 factor (ECF subfamily)